MAPLDAKIINIFCGLYGENYRGSLTRDKHERYPEWDSNTFLDFVMALEDEYNVTFTDEEATQMFQLGHVQRLVKAAVLNIPHDDVANAPLLAYNLRRADPSSFNLLILSGSSTRGRGYLCRGKRRRAYGPRWAPMRVGVQLQRKRACPCRNAAVSRTGWRTMERGDCSGNVASDLRRLRQNRVREVRQS